jgi:MurNAc alpha-1-phosphate uridylyltransferase
MSARLRTEPAWPPRLALLAGGMATRLHPLSLDTPKSMMRVAGEPFIAHQLCWFRNNGLREIVICCGHLCCHIQNFAGDGSRFGLHIQYSHDGESPLGTGGAIRAALPLLGRRFLIMYGDSWLAEPIEPIWRAFRNAGKPALMTVFRNDNRWGTSNVEQHNGTIRRYDKHNPSPAMHSIDYGLSAMESDVLARWKSRTFDLAEVWSTLAASGQLAAYEARSRFYEIGSLAGLRETEAVIAAAQIPPRLQPASVPLPTRTHEVLE